MTAQRCRICGREFPETEQFCSQDGARLAGRDTETEAETELDANVMRDLLVGCTLDGRYRVVRVIGEGGMGVVYEALHIVLEKRVAIKVLRDTFSARADVVERFRQEAKSASKIGHPNIVDVSDFGETPSGQSYIVMEMLTGEDLADLLARVRVLPPTRAVRIVYQVARALDATHKKSIVHRDLKPENIYLVERDGVEDFVKVVDFGVAKMSEPETAKGRKLTRTGMLFGTPEYMSPEQALGQGFDHRIDVYALGAILFELLTGRVPFVGESFMGILAQHGHTPLPSLHSVNPSVSVSPEVNAIVQRALAKEPSARYQTMGALAEELRNTPEMPASSPTDANVHGAKWAPTTPFTIVHADADADSAELRETADTTEVVSTQARGAERSVTVRTLPVLADPGARDAYEAHAADEAADVRPDGGVSESALGMVQALGARFAPPHVIAVGLLAAVLMFGMVAISAQRTSRPRLLQGTSSSEPLLSHTASPTAPTQTPGPALAADALRGLDAAMESKGPEGGARLGENESATDDPRARGANANCGSGGCAAQNQSGTAPRRLKASPGVSFPDAPASGEPAAQHEISQRWPRERHEHPQPPEPLADGSEAERIPGLPPSKRGSVSTTPVLKKAHAPTDLKIPSAFR